MSRFCWCTTGLCSWLSTIFNFNDVSENILSLYRLFADNYSLQCSSFSVANIEYVLNHDLKVLKNLSSNWLLKFNPSKTKALFFILKSNFYFPKLQFPKNRRLKFVSSHKHLGLLFCQNLCWSEYIDNIIKYAYQI